MVMGYVLLPSSKITSARFQQTRLCFWGFRGEGKEEGVLFFSHHCTDDTKEGFSPGSQCHYIISSSLLVFMLKWLFGCGEKSNTVHVNFSTRHPGWTVSWKAGVNKEPRELRKADCMLRESFQGG